jgi:RNA polymerase sigma factor (sigma-70 family)
VSPLSHKQESEDQLITRAQQGDREAFGNLVMNHHAAIYMMIYRMTGDVSLSEDATQQAFIKAWLHLPTYQPRSSLRSWLSRIAMNTCLDSLRREKRFVLDEESISETRDPQPGPESALINKQRSQTIRDALLALNDSNRSVLVLREFSGMSYQEIASVLNIPLGTVMSRLNTARVQLRSILQPLLEEIEVVYG